MKPNSLILTLSTLFISASSLYVPTCLASCENNGNENISEYNAREIARICFASSEVKDLDTLAPRLFLLSYQEDTCSDKIYDIIDKEIQYGASPPLPCQAFCNGSEVSNYPVSFQDAEDCFATMSPPLKMTFDELHQMYSDAYTFIGRCHFREFNSREAAIRNVINNL
jgi:hypothetical protein